MGFEMQENNTMALHGAGVGSAVVESEGRVTEVTTFVDELFTLCLDVR